jgi:hypothetical protein
MCGLAEYSQPADQRRSKEACMKIYHFLNQEEARINNERVTPQFFNGVVVSGIIWRFAANHQSIRIHPSTHES